MGRLIVLGVGIVGGAIGLRRVQKAARTYSPGGVAERAGGWWEDAKDFGAEVRAAMVEREQQLRIALEVDAGVMDEHEAQALLDHPAGHADR